jgi:hypothetical protein
MMTRAPRAFAVPSNVSVLHGWRADRVPVEHSGEQPGFTASRPGHRHWSGVRHNPHRLRAGCSCEFIQPGQGYYVLADPERGHAVVCQRHYDQARAEEDAADV